MANYSWSWDDFLGNFLPGYSANENAYGSKYYDEALAQIDDIYNNLDTTRKTAKQHYEAGRETAGMEAADKAGLAKREAKASAAMNGAGKMTQAVQGAQAASDASREGYDEAANTAASMSQAQENAEKQAELNKAQQQASSLLQTAAGKANAAAQAQAAKEKKRSDTLNAGATLTSGLLGWGK